MMSCDYPHPVSRTYQYKKITKPLLERKRRARINRCLDELKDLMVDALETEGENISKLEKADILELTVRHLQRLHASRPSGLSSLISTTADGSNETRWQSGFGHCAAEACKYLAALPGKSGEKLARHLATELQSSRKITVKIMSNEGETISPTTKNIDTNSNHLELHTDMNLSPMTESHSTSSPIIWPQYCEVTDGSEIKSPNNFIAQKNISIPNALSSSTSAMNVVNVSQNAPDIMTRDDRNEDDEEIDVERIDDNDPMWRPW